MFEAPRMTPKNIAGVMEGYAAAGESPPWSVVSAAVDAVAREAVNMDADEIADVVGAFARARVCGKLSAVAKSGLDDAVAREAPRMYARDVAAVTRDRALADVDPAGTERAGDRRGLHVARGHGDRRRPARA